MMYKEQKGHSIRNERNVVLLSSFVKKDLIDEPQVSTNYIIEEDIHRGYESVKCYPTPNV